MNIVKAEQNLKQITTNFSKETFIFDLMTAYDFPKSTISKLKIKSKNHDDVIVPSKFHFVGVSKKELDSKFDELVKKYSSVKKAPRFVIVTDYKSFKAYDMKVAEKLDTEIKNLSRYPDFFLPWTEIEKEVFQGENPADVKAAEKLAKFFDLILKDNLKLVENERHALNVFLTRTLFCFFAEDTDIFKKGLFTESLASHTKADGSDLDDYLQRLFEVLNRKSRSGLPGFLKEFPYVNGGLFAEEFSIPKFSKKSRESLIDLGSDLNWAEINPDIFGSMIQAVVHPDQRARLGMHYTSVTNIMKVIEPLFLSELKEEFANAKGSKNKLKKLLDRIGKIKIFDPACGSGNFLIISYKELRLLEMDILKALGEIPMSGITLSNFHGIEIDDFAHEVAKLSLWLTEHQMNVLFNKQFGNVKASLPLKDSGKIVCGNATTLDWEQVCKTAEECEVYLLGNPPYLGSSLQSSNQKEEMDIVFRGFENYKNLDYISNWFYLASKFISQKNAAAAFVTTNSICQGEQVEMLWPKIYSLDLEIGFAHKSFVWSNNAKNKAAVHCVIVGIRNKSNKPKYIYNNLSRFTAKNINPYLVPSDEIVILRKRSNPISRLPEMLYGSKPTDGGNLVFEDEDRKEILIKYPEAKKYLKKYIGADEFTSGRIRWCFWIEDTDLVEAIKIKEIAVRLEKVKKFRSESKKEATKKLARLPHRFAEIRYKNLNAIMVPIHGSDRREYIPFGFLEKGVVISNAAQAIYTDDISVLGVVLSRMHNLWIDVSCGKIKGDPRYSSTLGYNNFPLPSLSKETQEKISKSTQRILQAREKYLGKSLSDLYDPDLMPEELRSAHNELDSVVESLYSDKKFKSNDERLQSLFNLYIQMSKQ